MRFSMHQELTFHAFVVKVDNFLPQLPNLIKTQLRLFVDKLAKNCTVLPVKDPDPDPESCSRIYRPSFRENKPKTGSKNSGTRHDYGSKSSAHGILIFNIRYFGVDSPAVEVSSRICAAVCASGFM
jgi:hypothetical protein